MSLHFRRVLLPYSYETYDLAQVHVWNRYSCNV